MSANAFFCSTGALQPSPCSYSGFVVLTHKDLNYSWQCVIAQDLEEVICLNTRATVHKLWNKRSYFFLIMLKFHGFCELNENISKDFIMRPTWGQGKGNSSSHSAWCFKRLPNSPASGLTTPTLLFLPKNQMHLSLFPGLWQKGALLWAWDHPQTVGSLWTGKPGAHKEHVACFLKMGRSLKLRQSALPATVHSPYSQWPPYMVRVLATWNSCPHAWLTRARLLT